MEFSSEELRTDTYRSDKNDYAVRIVHLPTGTVVTSEDEPTVGQNRDRAMQLLRQALTE